MEITQLDLLSLPGAFDTEPCAAPVRLLRRWVGKSETKTRGKSFWYYRYYWQRGGDRLPQWRHIPGGRLATKQGEERRKVIEMLIRCNVSHVRVIEMLNEWNEGRGHSSSQGDNLESHLLPDWG